MRLFAALVVSSSVFYTAHASFELLLVGDNGVNTFETRRIHRFEARTGVYLGSFGGFDSAIVSSWLRQSTNSLFVHEQNGISEWDYNTGALKSATFFPLGNDRITARPDGTRAAWFNGGADLFVTNYPVPGSSTTTGFFAGATWRAGIWHSPNRILAYSSATEQFFNIDMDASGTFGTVTINSTAIFSPGFGQIARNAGTNDYIMAAGSTLKLVNGNTLSAGAFLSPFGTSKAAASAHNGFFIGGTNGTTGLITYYDNQINRRAQFGGAVLRDPVTMEAVLAPEPGTMIALGAGLAAILRRRKARRK